MAVCLCTEFCETHKDERCYVQSCCKNFDPNGPRHVECPGRNLCTPVSTTRLRLDRILQNPCLYFVKISCTKSADTRSQIDERIDMCGLLILLRTKVHFIASFCHPLSMSVAVILPCQLLSTCRFLSPCHCVSLSPSVLCCSHSPSVSLPMPAGYAGAFQRGANFPPHVGTPAVQ